MNASVPSSLRQQLRGTHLHELLYLHRNTNPGAQRVAVSTHPFLAAFLSTVQLLPLGFSMKLFAAELGAFWKIHSHKGMGMV